MLEYLMDQGSGVKIVLGIIVFICFGSIMFGKKGGNGGGGGNSNPPSPPSGN